MKNGVSSAARFASVALATALTLGLTGSALAVDWKGRWSVGVRGGLFLHADEQGGGFRTSGTTFGQIDERTVNLQDGPFAGLTLGYGIASFQGKSRWSTADLTLQLEVSRMELNIGDETAFVDLNASTRIELPGALFPRDGDEGNRTFRLGEVTMTPIMLNALLHWGSERSDFYAGLGAGVVLADATVGEEYAEFVGDAGRDDLTADDALALNVKLGSNVRLNRKGRWYLYFEGQFFATQVLSSTQQVSWPGVEGFFGIQHLDTDGDGVPATPFPADFRLIDPGQVRLDGALVTVGIRYRFGGGDRE